MASQQSASRYDTPPDDDLLEALAAAEAIATLASSTQAPPARPSTPPAQVRPAPVNPVRAGPSTPQRQIIPSQVSRPPPLLRKKQTFLSRSSFGFKRTRTPPPAAEGTEQAPQKKARRNADFEDIDGDRPAKESKRPVTYASRRAWKAWVKAHQLASPAMTPPSSQERGQGKGEAALGTQTPPSSQNDGKGKAKAIERAFPDEEAELVGLFFNVTESSAVFKLTAEELKCLVHEECENPFDPTYAPQKLYAQRELFKLAFRKEAVLGGIDAGVDDGELVRLGEVMFVERNGPLREFEEKKLREHWRRKDAKRREKALREASPTPTQKLSGPAGTAAGV